MVNEDFNGKKYFQLDTEQSINWIRLIRSQNVGPVTFRDLISHYGTAKNALEAIPELAKRGGSAARIKIFSRQAAESELLRAEQNNARFIGIGEPEYPDNLRNYDGSPPLLCIKGAVSALNRKSLAIVGSRNASIAGMKITEILARQVGASGYKIVSGLARGIDTIAHKSSLETGTVAVFAGGVNVVFPEENQKLVDDILEHSGAIVSEMPMGWRPRSTDFPKRNRIISGLALAILVVEAAKRSGSLITARLANEAGRTVLAFPSSPLDPRSDGTNRLIRQGATLVRNAEDVIEALEPLSGDDLFMSQDVDEEDGLPFEDDNRFARELHDETREVITRSLGPSPVSIDDVIQYSGASPGEVQLTLLELDIAGRLERHPGGLVSIPG